MNSLKEAFADFKNGLGNRFWWILSVHDIKGRYRRTFFGPWWLTIGTGIALLSIGLVWSALFNMEMAKLFPYLTIGYVLWMMLASFLTEGCSTFTNGVSSNLQQNYLLPKSIHIYRLVGRSLLIFLHNIVIFVLAAAYFKIIPNAWTLLAIPGFFLFVINGVWMSSVLGILGARFRDIEPLITAFLTLLFLISPIVWHADALSSRRYLIDWNPVSHYLSIVRDPLLGHAPPMLSWLVVGGITIVGFSIAFYLHGNFKNRLAYWL